MSKRSIRRAAKRAARKLQPKSQSITPTAPPPTAPTQEAKKFLTATAMMQETPMGPPEYYIQLPDIPPDPEPEPDYAQLARDRRAAINRENAQHSTGPRSYEGRQTSARNALKHGLTGHTVLLDADLYQQGIDETVAEFQPATPEERRLAQSIHDCAWRLARVISLVEAYFAKGRVRYANYFLGEPEDQRKTFIQLETALYYRKELRNLDIQEGRLNRQREKDIKVLQTMRKERLAAEAEKQKQSAAPVAMPTPEAEPSSPSNPAPQTKDGFVFEKYELVLDRNSPFVFAPPKSTPQDQEGNEN